MTISTSSSISISVSVPISISVAISVARLAVVALAAVLAVPTAAASPATERRLYSDAVEASSFLWNDWNKLLENYHPNYVADDDPATTWTEGHASSGAGQWLRIPVTPLADTTRIRLRIRNGYQKSKALWKANARAREITLRLVPGNVEKRLELTDSDGWQDVSIEQPKGAVQAIELTVSSVYEGTKYADLCLSDVQVFATSESPDNAALEKSKRAKLMSWRAERIAAAKLFRAKRDLPLYPAYVATTTSFREPSMDDSPERKVMIAEAQQDPKFRRHWKDALALAERLECDLDVMTRARLAPSSRKPLVAVDGLQVPEPPHPLSDSEPDLRVDALRLPTLGIVEALFVEQLRVLALESPLKVTDHLVSQEPCKSDVVWVARSASVEAIGPAKVQALAHGRCARVEGREGWYNAHTIELLIYDATGKLVLLVGDGHIDGYRWTTDAGKPMLAGGRARLWTGHIVEVVQRAAVAKP